MAIKEPGHGLIMIRRVRAHDRGLFVCVCVLSVHKCICHMFGLYTFVSVYSVRV